MRFFGTCALIASLAGCASEQPYLHSFSAGIGERDVGDDFGRADRQRAFAFEYDVRAEGVPLGLEMGLTRSEDDFSVDVSDLGLGVDRVDLGVSTTSAYAGLRHVWEGPEQWRGYLSGGVTYLDTEFKALGESLSADDFAPYAGAGIDYQLSENWFIGAGVRYVFESDLEYLGVEGDADGLIALFKIGYGFWSKGPRPIRR